MTGRLSGKVVLVDADRHDSEAIARGLGGEGATIVLYGDDAERAGRLLSSIEAEGNGRAAFFRLGPDADVAVEALVAFVEEMFAKGGQSARGEP